MKLTTSILSLSLANTSEQLCQWTQWHYLLIYWGRMTQMCVSKLAIIGSDNGLSPGRRQAIIWTNAGLLLFGPLGTNFSEILIKIYTFSFSFKKMHLKMSPWKWRPLRLGLNGLNCCLLSNERHSLVYIIINLPLIWSNNTKMKRNYTSLSNWSKEYSL